MRDKYTWGKSGLWLGDPFLPHNSNNEKGHWLRTYIPIENSLADQNCDFPRTRNVNICMISKVSAMFKPYLLSLCSFLIGNQHSNSLLIIISQECDATSVLERNMKLLISKRVRPSFRPTRRHCLSNTCPRTS